MIRRTAPAPAPCALVVDPDPDTRSLHLVTLQPLFPDVEEADDGAEALARAIARRPSLIVSELRLPRVDGYSLCGMLRSEPATRGTAILIVTASAMPVDIDRARRAGADDVLVKPCSPDQIVERSRTLVRARSEAPASVVAQPLPAAPLAPPAPDRDAPRISARRRFIREVTTTPLLAPPELRCPGCDRLLAYDHSYVGGVSAARREQWDHYCCASCGRFVYRHRTRKLRAVP